MNTDLSRVLGEAFERAVAAVVGEQLGQMANMLGAMRNQQVDHEREINELRQDVTNLKQRVAALELRIPVEGMSEMRVKTMIDSALETAFRQHGEEYDHDSFESAAEEVESVDFSTLMNEDNIEEAVRRLFRNASLSVDF